MRLVILKLMEEKNSQVVFSILAIIVFIVVVAGVFFYFKNKQSLLPSSSSNTISNGNAAVLPVPLDHPNVVSSSLYYVFKGQVVDVSSEGIQLKSLGSALPFFTFAPKVQVIKTEVIGKSNPASVGDIKKGDNVFLTVLLDPKKSTWTVSHVSVVALNAPVVTAAPSNTTVITVTPAPISATTAPTPAQ